MVTDQGTDNASDAGPRSQVAAAPISHLSVPTRMKSSSGAAGDRPGGVMGADAENEIALPPDVKDELEGRALNFLSTTNPIRVFLARVSRIG